MSWKWKSRAQAKRCLAYLETRPKAHQVAFWLVERVYLTPGQLLRTAFGGVDPKEALKWVLESWWELLVKGLGLLALAVVVPVFIVLAAVTWPLRLLAGPVYSRMARHLDQRSRILAMGETD